MISILFVLGVLSLLIGLSVWFLFRADEAMREDEARRVRLSTAPPEPVAPPRREPVKTVASEPAPPPVVVPAPPKPAKAAVLPPKLAPVPPRPLPAPVPPEPKIIERVVEVIKEVFVPAPTVPPDLVTVRFTSGRGRVLGEARIPKKARRPCLRHRVAGTLGVFQASHDEADGTRVYRRVGVERE